MNLYPADLAEWFECPTKKRDSGRRGEADVQHVGQVVGNAVHQAVTGQAVEVKDYIEYDEVTRDYRELHMHTLQINENLIPIIGPMNIARREVSLNRIVRVGDDEIDVRGKLDLVTGEDDEGYDGVYDLKITKQWPGAAWVQVAAYAWLVAVTDDLRPEPHRAGIIWSQRGGEWRTEVVTRDLEEMIAPGFQAIRTVAQWLVSDEIPRIPSARACASCTLVECPLRFDVENQ